MYEKTVNVDKVWREGVYLITAETTLEADILESKLTGEGIHCIKKYKGAGNAMEIIMGSNSAFDIDIYVSEQNLEDAQNIIVPIPLTEEAFDEENF